MQVSYCLIIFLKIDFILSWFFIPDVVQFFPHSVSIVKPIFWGTQKDLCIFRNLTKNAEALCLDAI